MADEEVDLKTALQAIAAETRYTREALARSERELTELRHLVTRLSGDLEREGSTLTATAKESVDAAARSLARARLIGTESEVVEAEEIGRLAIAVYVSASKLRASTAYFKVEAALQQQGGA